MGRAIAPTTQQSAAPSPYSTARAVRDRLAGAEPRLAFRPGMTAPEAAAWRRRVRAKLRQLLGLGVPPKPQFRQVLSERREGYALERWEMILEPGWTVPFLALVPDSATAQCPAPAVLCFPGTDHSKELLAGEPELPGAAARYHKYPAHPDRERMAWHYARAGFVSVCVDNPGTQETWHASCPGRTELSQHLIINGQCYFTLGVCVALGLYRWLRARKCVDGRRIATSGFSLGTNAALMSAILEPRIAAVVHCGHLGSQRDRFLSMGLTGEKMWQVIPGISAWFDRPDLAAALAPRPLLVCEGAAPWHARRVREAYRSAHASDRLKITYNPAYATAASRRHAERLAGPPRGVTEEEFKRCICQDSPNHYFKPEIAVPWLTRMLRPT